MKEKDLIVQAVSIDMPNIEAVREKSINQEIGKKYKHTIWVKRIAPIAVCAVIILAILIAVPHLNNNLNNNGIIAEHGEETTNSHHSTVESQTSAKEPITNLFINELSSGLSANKMFYNLSLDDYVSMSKQEICNFYGVDIFPSIIPSDMTEDTEEVIYGIYKRDHGAGEIYYSQNVVNYYNKKFTKYINIEVEKGQLPFTDIAFNMNDDSKTKSVINDNEVLIGHYTADKDEYYIAVFIYKDVGFRIICDNLSKEEFVDMLASILK